MTRAWLLVGALLAVIWIPHVVFAAWVYEDAGWLPLFTDPLSPLLVPRGGIRAFWWLQGQVTTEPWLVHGVNVGLHLTVIGLTLALARRLGLPRAVLPIVLVIVALHPLGIEAVAYAAQQGELVAAVAVLGACLLATGCWWRLPVVLGMLACLAFGVWGGKETAVVGLGLVPLVIALRARDDRPKWAGKWLPLTVCILLVFAGVQLSGGLVELTNTGETTHVYTSADEWSRWQSAATVRMLGLLVLPLGPFTVDYDYHRWSQGAQVACGALLVLMAITGVVAALVRRRMLTFWLLWPLLAIAPRFVVETPRGILNEHQVYLWVPGFAVSVGAVVSWWQGASCRAQA